MKLFIMVLTALMFGISGLHAGDTLVDPNSGKPNDGQYHPGVEYNSRSLVTVDDGSRINKTQAQRDEEKKAAEEFEARGQRFEETMRIVEAQNKAVAAGEKEWDKKSVYMKYYRKKSK